MASQRMGGGDSSQVQSTKAPLGPTVHAAGTTTHARSGYPSSLVCGGRAMLLAAHAWRVRSVAGIGGAVGHAQHGMLWRAARAAIASSCCCQSWLAPLSVGPERMGCGGGAGAARVRVSARCMAGATRARAPLHLRAGGLPDRPGRDVHAQLATAVGLRVEESTARR